MTPERFGRIDELFQAVRRLPGVERSAYLHDRCGLDVELRAEVEALLAHDSEPQDCLRTPALGAALQWLSGRTVAGGDGAAPLPAAIGRYRILEVIGEGGFGVVYRAEQENPRRTVAVKVIKPHLATPSMLRRFEHEAQLLGRLQHPGIAQIYEAGVVERPGAPEAQLAYFAMEYVEGARLDHYVRQRSLAPPDVLRLMAAVCDAVQYAHQRGVIHRDLKPGNVMVAEADPQSDAHRSGSARGTPAWSGPMPKILDFGVARTTDADPQITTMGTSVGQLVGTLPYMSPEQVLGDPGEIDTRSDVYALGVMIYELLAGRLPLDFRGCSMVEAARRIREEQPTRLGSVRRDLRGEIEIIVAKAMEKDRGRRYAGAGELAADLRRAVAGEPIEARRDSALYVLRKTLRRYRGAVLAAGATVALLVAFSVHAARQAAANLDLAERESLARGVAVSSLRDAEIAQRRAEEQLTISNIERGRLLAAGGNAAAGESLLWRELLRDPASTHARWALWELYQRHPVRARFAAHEAPIYVMRLSPDGERLFTGAADGRLRAWSVPSGRLLADAQAAPDGLRDAVVLSGGDALAVATRGGELLIWDVATWTARHRLRLAQGTLLSVSATPDESLLICAADGDRLIAVDPREGVIRFDVPSITTGLQDAAVLSAEHVVTVANDRTVRTWRIRPDEAGRPAGLDPLRALPGERRAVSMIAVTADRTRFATAGRDAVVTVWDAATGDPLLRLESPRDTVRAIGFSPDGRVLGMAAWWTVWLWDTTSGQLIRSIPAHTGTTRFCIAPDGRMITAGESVVRVWDGESAGPFSAIELNDTGVTGVDVGGMGQVIWTACTDDRIRAWDAQTLERVLTFGMGGSALRVRASPDGRRLLVSTRAREFFLFDTADYSVVTWQRLFSGMGRGASQDFSSAGGLMLSARPGARLAIGSTEDGRTFCQTLPGAIDIFAAVLSPDGRMFASAAREPLVRLYDARTCEELGRIPLARGTQAWAIAFSPDSSLLAIGLWDPVIEVWDWRDCRLVAVLEGHTETIADLTFSPNGAELVSASGDGLVKLWDPRRGLCLLTLDARRGRAEALRFIPDPADAVGMAVDTGARRIGAARSDGDQRPAAGGLVQTPAPRRPGGYRLFVGYGEGGGVWNLGYYDRHIAGNAVEQARLLAGSAEESARLREAAAAIGSWAD